MKSALASIAAGGLLLTFTVAAQTTRQSATRPAAARPVSRTTATPTPAPVPSAATPSFDLSTPVAIVNGQTLTLRDLNPQVVQELAQAEPQIADLRRQLLDVQINTQLLALEALKRRVSPQQYYDLEVTRRVTDPTDAAINEFIENNHRQLADVDPKTVRDRVISLLRDQREQQLGDALSQRLRAATPVTILADINDPNLKPETVVARVAGQPVVARDLIERLKPVIYDLRESAYQMERRALDQTIDDVLILAEAQKRNVAPEEIIRAEITQKLHRPTEAEVAKYYADNKAQINADLDTVRPQLTSFLEQQEQDRLQQALSDRLRSGGNIRILITEPVAPVQSINTAGEPARGDANAAVTIVEFTDFQCPSCAAMYPVLDDLVKSYGNRIRFVVRNFPLPQHANARKAAEAADAANRQGKFFEYTALLFKRQNALDVPSLKKYASEIGLNRAQFDAELDSGAYAPEVRKDINDGQIYGVSGTPTIFINGVKVRELSAQGLRATIDRELAKAR